MSGKDTRKKAKKESRKKDTPSSRKRKSFTMMSSSTPRAFDDDDEEGPSNEGNEEIQALSRQLNKKGLQHIVTALAKQGLGLADLLLCEPKEMRQSVKEVLLDAQSDIDEQQITSFVSVMSEPGVKKSDNYVAMLREQLKAKNLDYIAELLEKQQETRTLSDVLKLPRPQLNKLLSGITLDKESSSSGKINASHRILFNNAVDAIRPKMLHKMREALDYSSNDETDPAADWLRENKLQQLEQYFADNMRFDNLKNLGEEGINGILDDCEHLNLSIATKHGFKNAVRKLQYESTKRDATPGSETSGWAPWLNQVYRIVITAKEQKAMTQLEEKQKEVEAKLLESQKEKASIESGLTEMDSTIEATFNAYIETLEARRATLRTELRAEREAQIKALDCVEANMVRYRKNLHEMLEKELAMIVDPATTSADREVELEKMTKKTLDDINKDHLVLPLVEIKFDPAKEADDFLTKIGSVSGRPAAPTLTSKDVKMDTAALTIKIDGIDKATILYFVRYIKDTDELEIKEEEGQEAWEELEFKANTDTCALTKLEPNTNYRLVGYYKSIAKQIVSKASSQIKFKTDEQPFPPTLNVSKQEAYSAVVSLDSAEPADQVIYTIKYRELTKEEEAKLDEDEADDDEDQVELLPMGTYDEDQADDGKESEVKEKEPEPEPEWKKKEIGGVKTYTITELKLDVGYLVVATLKNKTTGYVSEQSQEQRFKTILTRPTLKIGERKLTKVPITLEHKLTKNSIRFLLEYQPKTDELEEEKGWTPVEPEVAENTNTYTLEKLDEDTEYLVRARVKKDNTVSEPSETALVGSFMSFEWDPDKSHQDITLSNGQKNDTLTTGTPRSVLSKKKLSASKMDYVHWEVTLKKRAANNLKIYMCFIGESEYAGAKTDQVFGLSKDGYRGIAFRVDNLEGFGIYTENDNVPLKGHGQTVDEVKADDRFGIKFNFVESKADVYYNDTRLGIFSNNLPSSGYPAVCLGQSGEELEVTKFEITKKK